MPRYGSETPFERDSRLIKEGRDKKPNPAGGRNPFATPIKKAKRLPGERKGYNV
tara:strand:+ start:7946 stop:8107 length:162 start_codon:yes stop_codon:yes gene_type:complete